MPDLFLSIVSVISAPKKTTRRQLAAWRLSSFRSRRYESSSRQCGQSEAKAHAAFGQKLIPGIRIIVSIAIWTSLHFKKQ